MNECVCTNLSRQRNVAGRNYKHNATYFLLCSGESLHFLWWWCLLFSIFLGPWKEQKWSLKVLEKFLKCCLTKCV